MARIRISTFGGIQPSVNPRNIPDESAQIAENLDLRFGDFRPLRGPGAAVATVAAGTRSIFRTPSGTWLSSTNDVNYVNGQINDAASDRVYLTGRSSYPEAWQDDQYRRLGVPAPTLAPSLTVTANGEFTSEELAEASPKILAAVKAAIVDNATQILLGNDPSPTSFGGTSGGDPLAHYVQLHLRFNGTAGSNSITDSSPANRAVTPGSVTLADGSFLTGGGQYGVFTTGTQGLSVGTINATATTAWAVEFYFCCNSTVNYLVWGVRNGVLSKFIVSPNSDDNSGWHLFTMFERSGFDTESSVAFGSSIVAGTTTKVQVINTLDGSTRFYINGVLVQTIPSVALNLHRIGWDGYPSNRNLGGSMDEFRVTVGAVRTASAALEVWSDAATGDGFYLEHGTVTTPVLPTTKEGDWAWLVPMSEVNGEWVTSSPTNSYLLNTGFNSRRVTYGGAEYLATPIAYQAQGYSIDYAGVLAALKAIKNPEDGTSQLLPDDVAEAMAQEISDKVDSTKEPVSGYILTINSKQGVVDSQLKSTDTSSSRSSTTLSAIADLRSSVSSAESYFSFLTTNIDNYAAELYSKYVEGVIPTAVGIQIETRAYVYTYVTDWGEESAPSPASALVETDQNDTVGVTVFAPPPGRNIVGWRLYRSSTTGFGAAYQLIADKTVGNAVLDGTSFNYFAITGLTYEDALRQEELQETLQTLTWLEPPENLVGLVGLPNGILAGFFGKTVCFSEPFAPYAWPLEYQLTTEHNIVGLGVFGQTLVVLTKGWPYYASGADSASMSLQKLEQPQACISKRSIVSMDNGVLYASPDGLCLAGPDGIRVLSQAAFSKEDWQQAVGAAPLGMYHEGRYFIINTDAPA